MSEPIKNVVNEEVLEEINKKVSFGVKKYILHNTYAHNEVFKDDGNSKIVVPDNIIRNTITHRRCMNTLANQFKYDSVKTTDIREAMLFRKNIMKQLNQWKEYLDCNIVVTDKVDVIPYYEKGTDVNLYTITVWVKDKDTEFPDGFCMDPEFLRNYGKEEE